MKLDQYQKCGNIISQTSLLSSYTGSVMQIQTVDKNGGYSESTEPIDAVNILPLARFEPTTSATPPSTTPDTNATNCATEISPRKDIQEALILTTTDAVHVVYWFLFYGWHLFRSQVKA